MPDTQVKQEKTVKRVVRVLIADYFQQGIDPITGNTVRFVLSAPRGQEIEVPESEARRLDAIGAVMPEGSSTDEAFEQQAALLDHYRGLRGDTEAMGRALDRARQQAPDLNDGGIVNLDAPLGSPVASLAEWIKDTKPNADDTVALAENDPDKARKVLEAERLATENNPRATVEQRLTKIAEG